MQELKTLIDKAIEMCGSVDALAKKMGVQPNVISMLKNGRTITPETAAELADIAGLDARQAAIVAIIVRARGTRREGAMQKILGKSLAGGVAAMLVFSYATESNSSTVERSANINQVTSLYNAECMARWFARFFKRPILHWHQRFSLRFQSVGHAENLCR